MKYYFAPMEGLTGHIYRNAHQEFFPEQIDKYFTPFISPNHKTELKSRALNDILPEHNEGIPLIPQILTNRAEDFIRTAKQLKAFGYEEINLNLGCPSGTVVAKGKGSGFLAKKEELSAFLEAIFSEAVTRISIKTRLGKSEPEEFYELLEIYNQYPLAELIIHPRTQKDYYKNKPNLEVFSEALSGSQNQVCYNGNIFSVRDYEKINHRFPSVEVVMLGRGLISNPGLAGQIKNDVRLDKQLLKAFYDRLYNDYRIEMSGDRNLLFKMKEMWSYMAVLFTNYEKYAKKIRKSERRIDYETVVASLFREQEIAVAGQMSER